MKATRKRIGAIALLAGISSTSFAVDAKSAQWVGSWAAAPTLLPLKDPVGDSTFRNVVHLSLGGSAIRITLTNQFGTSPLRIDDAHVALSAGSGNIDPASDHPLTFNHHTSASIPPGSYLISDPISMPVAAFTDLAISLYLPAQPVAAPTCHEISLSTNYVAAGDAAKETTLPDSRTQTSWCFLQSVDVQTEEKDAAAIVTLGDSITDGARSTIDANHRYTDYLAARLHANRKTAHLSVLNEGISGGRVLYEGHGPSVMQRLDRDVFAQPGVRYLIYMEGINDIGQITRPASPEKTLTADELILAATQLVMRAHQHGIRVLGATLLPFGPKNPPANSDWPEARQVLDQYNTWVRTSSVFDGVADLNQATADPLSPETILPAYDSGDHVHPSDAGYNAMARAIDLNAFSQ